MNRRLQGRRNFLDSSVPKRVSVQIRKAGKYMKRAVTLKENYEFRRLYQKGVSAVGGGMVIYCRKNRLGHNRLGVTVSVKLGHAVVRNRARRRLREVYRLNGDKLRQGYDIILVARTRTTAVPWKDLNDTFIRLCRKLDLLEKKA